MMTFPLKSTKGDDQTRREIAVLLLKYTVWVVTFTLLGCFILIALNKLEADNAITIILAAANIFSALLGSAITYYFSSK